MPSNNGNLIKENDKLIQNICDLLLNILFHNSIFADNFLLTCKALLYFINNEKIFKFKEQSVFDVYINLLINFLRKNILNEEINLETIKTFISFGEYKNELYNILLQKGCIKLILQFLIITNNSKLCLESIHLLKNICFSSQKNLITLADQNIMNSLCEIHIKFINDEKIINSIDIIINEIKKLPGQGVHIEDLLLNALKNFDENIKKNFNNDNIKYKLLFFSLIQFGM